MLFQIVGAYKQTGEDITLEIEAPNEDEAHLIANHRGILVSSCVQKKTRPVAPPAAVSASARSRSDESYRTGESGAHDEIPLADSPSKSAAVAAASDTKECPRCGETIKTKAKICRFCQYSYEQAVDASVTANVASQHEVTTDSLWNPSAAVNWSVVFGPLFGMYLHYRNWKTLHQDKPSSVAMAWVGIGVALELGRLLLLLGGLLRPDLQSEFAQAWPLYAAAYIGFLFVWYWGFARKQMKLIQLNFGQNYPRRSWAIPLLIGFAYLVFVLILGQMASPGGTSRQREAASDANIHQNAPAAPKPQEQQPPAAAAPAPAIKFDAKALRDKLEDSKYLYAKDGVYLVRSVSIQHSNEVEYPYAIVITVTSTIKAVADPTDKAVYTFYVNDDYRLSDTYGVSGGERPDYESENVIKWVKFVTDMLRNPF